MALVVDFEKVRDLVLCSSVSVCGLAAGFFLIPVWYGAEWTGLLVFLALGLAVILAAGRAANAAPGRKSSRAFLAERFLETIFLGGLLILVLVELRA